MSVVAGFRRLSINGAYCSALAMPKRSLRSVIDSDDWVPISSSIDVTRPRRNNDEGRSLRGGNDNNNLERGSERSWMTSKKINHGSPYTSRRSEGRSWSDRKPNAERADSRYGGKPSFASRKTEDRSWKDRKPMHSDRAHGYYGAKSSYASRRNDDRSWVDKKPMNAEPAYGHYDGDHLYGLNPVRLALKANRRKMSELLLQEGIDDGRSKDTSSLVLEIIRLAQGASIPVKYLPKHDLNMISDNRPHQGVILRASPLSFRKAEPLNPSESYKVVLALDEVWDPQNFGALLRSSYFLGCHSVVVCGKNSAPLSTAVSKASAGAMELMEVFSTDNMMKWLDQSKENGWQVIGTDTSSTAVPFKSASLTRPTILVLGNEGHGVRTNILNRCDQLVCIERRSPATETAVDIDSLNVSVTGGILIDHFTSKTI